MLIQNDSKWSFWSQIPICFWKRIWQLSTRSDTKFVPPTHRQGGPVYSFQGAHRRRIFVVFSEKLPLDSPRHDGGFSGHRDMLMNGRKPHVELLVSTDESSWSWRFEVCEEVDVPRCSMFFFFCVVIIPRWKFFPFQKSFHLPRRWRQDEINSRSTKAAFWSAKFGSDNSISSIVGIPLLSTSWSVGRWSQHGEMIEEKNIGKNHQKSWTWQFRSRINIILHPEFASSIYHQYIYSEIIRNVTLAGWNWHRLFFPYNQQQVVFLKAGWERFEGIFLFSTKWQVQRSLPDVAALSMWWQKFFVKLFTK